VSWPCNYCGYTNSDRVNVCANCGTKRGANQATREPQKTKTAKGSEKKEVKPADYLNFAAWIKAIGVTAFLAVIIVTNPLISSLNDSIMSFANFLNPDNTLTDAMWIVWVIAAICLLALFFYTLRYNSIWLGIVLIFVFTLVTVVLPMVYENNPTLAAALCTITNPQNVAYCQAGLSGNVPPAVKVGPTGVANVYFNTATYGMTLFGREDEYGNGIDINLDIYAMPIRVSNPSDTRIVKNFYVVSAQLYNSSASMKSSAKKPLGDPLTPDRCTQVSKCTLGPGDEMIINLRGSGVLADSTSAGAEVRLEYSYDYVGEGQNDFIFAANWTDLSRAKETSEGAKKFEGPVDVTVYFVPDSIVAPDASLYNGNVYVQVYLSKDEDVAHAQIRSPINITMFYGYTAGHDVFAAAKTCMASWGDDLSISTTYSTGAKTDSVEFGGTTLSVKQQLSCTYPYSLTPEDVNYPKTVKFVVRVDYSYIGKLTKRGILIQRTITPVD